MSKKLRSGFFALVAAVFALAVLIAPTVAKAAYDDTVYSNPQENIAITWESNSDLWDNTVDVTINVDGAQESKQLTGVPSDFNQLHVSAPGYIVNVDGDGAISPGGNGIWNITYVAGNNTHNLQITLTKTSADIEISDGSTSYGTFSWSKPNASNVNYERQVTIRVNGDDSNTYTQAVKTPETLTNGNNNREFWFTPNTSLYNASVEYSSLTLETTSATSGLTIDVTTRCQCGRSTCTCEGGADCTCPSGCECPDCMGNAENTVSGPWGTISYLPDTEDGFNLTVKVYVNDELAQTIEGLKIVNSRNGNLSFEPSANNGVYYFGAESSYDLETRLTSSWWNQDTGHLEFGASEEVDKTFPNVLSIYCYTYENYVDLDVWVRYRLAQGDLNPAERVNGYMISYEAVDPETHQLRTFSHEVTDFETAGEINFVNTKVPTNAQVTIEAICEPGYEVEQWYTDLSADVSLTGVDGEDTTVSRDYAYGNTAYLQVISSGYTAVQVWIDRMGLVNDPTPEELANAAALTVDCVNGYVSHDDTTVTPLIADTLAVGKPYVSGDAYLVDVTVAFEKYVENYNNSSEAGGATHMVADPDNQDNVITYQYANGEWKPVDGESPLVLEVKCDAKPEVPGDDVIKNLIGKVGVECANDNSGHVSTSYDVIDGSYTRPEPDQLSGDETNGYTYTVTVNAEKYVDQYSTDTKVEHELADGAEGSVKVTLINKGEGWTVQSGTPVSFEVDCEDVPTPPTDEDIKDFVAKNSVTVTCVTPNSGHPVKNFSEPLANTYNVGTVTSNNGTYTCDVTFGSADYVKAYVADNGTHTLDPNEKGQKTVTFTWDATTKKWVAPQDGAVDFDVVCDDTPDKPTIDELANIEGADVTVNCTGENNHDSVTYDPKSGAYTLTEPVKNDQGVYTVDMTVTPYAYVADFNKTNGEHTYADGEEVSKSVTLAYDAATKTWSVTGTPISYNVVCAVEEPVDETPDMPTPDVVKDLLADGAVTIDCINANVNHADVTYPVVDGAYTIGEVVEANGQYTSTITVRGGHYVLEFEKAHEGIHHWLEPDTQAEKTITLVYDATTGEWTLPAGAAPVTFTVMCADEPVVDPGTDPEPGTDPDQPGGDEEPGDDQKPGDDGNKPGDDGNKPGDDGNKPGDQPGGNQPGGSDQPGTTTPDETHTVTIVFGNGDPDETVTVKDGDKLTQPADPVRDGYKFVGWFTTKDENGNLSDPWDFNDPVTGDFTLYAGWVVADGGNDAAPSAGIPNTGDPTSVIAAVATAFGGVALVGASAVVRKRQK